MICGYDLVDPQGQTVTRWGGSYGSCPNVPNPIDIPDHGTVWGMKPGESVNGFSLQPLNIEPDLAATKTSLKASIDSAAEQTRQKYVTPGAGQAMTYDRKRREALQAAADSAPDATKYPVLSASIGLEVPDTGNPKNDFDAISNLVISKEVQWAQLAKQIEILRLGAKKAVDDASTVEAAQAAAQVVWP